MLLRANRPRAKVNPFQNNKFWTLLRKLEEFSKLEEFADNDFKFDENSRKISKRVENTEGKGEIAGHEQFLLFSKCFQKTFTGDTNNPGSFGKGLINFKFGENGRKSLKQVENTLRKGEIARYEQFLLFPQCFRRT